MVESNFHSWQYCISAKKEYLKYATVNGGSYSKNLQQHGDNAYNGLLIRNASLIRTAAIIINALIANEFYHIGCMKGHDERKYLLWCFLLLPIGMLMVVALPDRKNEEGAPTMEQTFISANSRQEIEKIPVPAQETKSGRCACCGRTVDSFPCPYCGN